MKILAIETSCDETSVAIIETSGARRQPTIRVLAHFISSQVELHAQFGGVVPNLAKREHQRLLVPLLVKSLKKSGIKNQVSSIKYQAGKKELSSSHDSLFVILDSILDRELELLAEFKKKIIPLPVPDIDAIAVTNGPGLAPALWVGINCAKALSLVWNKPIIPVNHMKGHIFSALLQCGKKNDQFPISNFQKNKDIVFSIPRIAFPMLALLVSGGHTELALMKKLGNYEIIGETLDDAAGEAFDKVARMLDLGYPGGPAISAQAEKNFQFFRQRRIRLWRTMNFQIKFPRPMMQSNNFDFSFSGLKTSVLYFIRDLADKKSVRAHTSAIAKEFQDAAVDVLVAKTIRGAQMYKAKTIIVGGGVSANKLLRERLALEVKDKCKGADFFVPHPSVTGDNALMIALAAVLDGNKKAPDEIGAEGNLRLGDV